MENQDRYKELLHPGLPMERRKENIQELAKDERYENKLFVLKGGKWSWEDEAKILITRGYPKVKDILPEMFIWLQDMNWPGSDEIVEFLSNLPREIMIENLEIVTKKAKTENDIGWLYWLREFMEKNKLNIDDFNDKEVYRILSSSTDM